VFIVDHGQRVSIPEPDSDDQPHERRLRREEVREEVDAGIHNTAPLEDVQPLGQLTQLALPNHAWYFPLAQLMQLALPDNPWYLPGTQSEQWVLPEPLAKCPVAQLMQLALPNNPWYLPGSQSEQ